MNKYQIFKELCEEINRAYQAQAFSAAIIMAYVVIDTMSYLAMSKSKKKNTSKDFISWVNKYLKAKESQPYQYSGEDLWSDRCAKLHCFSSFSNFGKKKGCKLLGHHTFNERHFYNPKVNDKLVLISIESFINDVISSIRNFIKAAKEDPNLRARIDSRIDKISQQHNYEHKDLQP